MYRGCRCTADATSEVMTSYDIDQVLKADHVSAIWIITYNFLAYFKRIKGLYG